MQPMARRCLIEQLEHHTLGVFCESRNLSGVTSKHGFNRTGAAITHAKPHDLWRCTLQNRELGDVFVFRYDDEAVSSRMKPDFRVGGTFKMQKPGVTTLRIEISQSCAEFVRDIVVE